MRLGAEPSLPRGIVRVNGRIEAEQIDSASKMPGCVTEVLVEEGQMVPAGAVVARLGTATLKAQLRTAEAQVREAEQARAADAELLLSAFTPAVYSVSTFRPCR